MKVLILHSLPPSVVDEGRSAAELDLGLAVAGLAEVLPEATVAGVRGEVQEVLELLSLHKPDVVFNACEAPLGRPDREAHVAALLEWLGIRFTGSGSETLALCRRKDRMNAVLEASGVAIPRRNVFPCIVKPADQDGSIGLDADSVCENEPAVARARARIAGPVVIQEFLPGREFAVSLWGRHEPEFVSVGEFCFQEGLRLNTYASKWDVQSVEYARSPISSIRPDNDQSVLDEVIATARGAWRAAEARGYIRVDVRLDSRGIPRVLDVNPNPEITPEVGINRAVIEAGWTWEEFVRKQIEWA